MSRDPRCICGYEEPDQECPVHGEVACLRAIRDDLTDRLVASESALAKALEEVETWEKSTPALQDFTERMQATNSSLRSDLAAAKAEVERLTKEREALHERFLSWRDVEPGDACPRCDGSGGRSYPSSAGWRGGIGGQVVTHGVCDKCWGSGSKSRPWLSHRQALAAFEAERAAERARDEAMDRLQTCAAEHDHFEKALVDALEAARGYHDEDYNQTVTRIVTERDEALAALREARAALKRIVVLWGSYQRPRGEPTHVLFAEFNDAVEAARMALDSRGGSRATSTPNKDKENK